MRTATGHNGHDTVSRCIFMPLDVDETVRIVNTGGTTAYSTEHGLETSFTGFQYYQFNGILVCHVLLGVCVCLCLCVCVLQYLWVLFMSLILEQT